MSVDPNERKSSRFPSAVKLRYDEEEIDENESEYDSDEYDSDEYDSDGSGEYDYQPLRDSDEDSESEQDTDELLPDYDRETDDSDDLPPVFFPGTPDSNRYPLDVDRINDLQRESELSFFFPR